MTIEIEQGTEEWFAARLGKVTASRVADVIAKTKSGVSASRANYAAELLCERLTGKAVDGFKSKAMEWGTETEDEARRTYAFRTGATITRVGFVPHPTIPMSGASPDSYVNDDGLLEIKCPNTATHLDTLLGGSIPKKYQTQMHWQMACSGRAWCDFVSFDPRLPPHLSLFIERQKRDEALILGLTADVRAFLAELDETMAALAAKYGEG